MTSPDVDPARAATPRVSGLAATMTIVATGLGCAVAGADRIILSTNISAVRTALDLSRTTGSFIAGLATLTLAAAVLAAGALGDVYGAKRMYMYGLLGTIIFGLLAAAAPNGAVLTAARAGVGVAFAFLLGLSLAIVSETSPPERRKKAIALFLAAGFALTAPLPAIGTWLAQQVGWRTCFLVAPAIAVICLVITARYVPELPRTARQLDRLGLLLIATALLGVVYGISRLESGPTTAVLIILAGLLAGGGFVYRELHTPEPALDLRIFRSKPFNAAVVAGITWAFVTGGSTVLFAFYLVSVRGQSPEILGLLFIPATALQAMAAGASGRAADRFGDRTVFVAGLLVLLAGLLTLALLDENTSTLMLFIAVSLNAIGSAIIQTPQSTIMMASAPAHLGGTVSAVRTAVGQASYSLGPAVLATVGTWFVIGERNRKMHELNITVEQGQEALQMVHGGAPAALHGQHVLSPQLAHEVTQGAEQMMLQAIHLLSLVMAAIPVLAIVAVLVLLPRKPAAEPPAAATTASE